MSKVRAKEMGCVAALSGDPKPNFLINFLSRRAQTTSENSVMAKFAEFLFYEVG